MRFWASRLLTVMAAAVLAVSVSTQAIAEEKGDRSRFLTKEGLLAAPLSFKDTQGGFAGFTGNTYSIMTDGSWTITRVFNRRKFKPHAAGKLSQTQLKRLAAVLTKNRVHQFPKSAGSRAQANPLVITITFGKKRSVIALPAGINDPKRLPKGSDGDLGRRVLAVRKVIRSLLTKPKKR